jgi:L-ascorbate metabolism protein UlaG (beta-lactamase superfamily)
MGASAALVMAWTLAGCAAKWNGPPSDHFDGSRFFNPGAEKSSSALGYLQLRLTQSQPRWPDIVLLAEPPAPIGPPSGPGVRVTWIGHATLLVQMAGLTVLTDPIWSERASPLSFVGPRRVMPASHPLEALPPIDLVLISHDHHDHLDPDTLRAIDRRDRPRVIVPLGTGALVERAMPNSRVSEHDWGERVPVGDGLIVRVEPMQHGSGRTPFDQMRRLWASYVLEGDARRVLFVGDSGAGDGRLWVDIAARVGPIDLAIVPIGASEPASFMADSHMSPAQAVQVLQWLGARHGLAHHFETFQLGFEAFEAPRWQFADAVRSAGLDPARFRALRPGEGWRLAAPEAPEAQGPSVPADPSLLTEQSMKTMMFTCHETRPSPRRKPPGRRPPCSPRTAIWARAWRSSRPRRGSAGRACTTPSATRRRSTGAPSTKPPRASRRWRGGCRPRPPAGRRSRTSSPRCATTA